MSDTGTLSEPEAKTGHDNIDNKENDYKINKNNKDNKKKKNKDRKGRGKYNIDNPDGKKIRRSFLSRFDLLNRFKHWYMGGISITRSMFRVRAAWQGVIIITAILTILFILSSFYTGAGEFVISLDSNMSKDGFYLANRDSFEEKLVCLRSEAVVADNINVFDIANDVDEVDGVHDGQNYVAHTFYLTNETGKTKDYQWSVNIRRSSKNAEKALWVMVFVNGKQTTYAMLGGDGEPEKQYSIYEFPFTDVASIPSQYETISNDEAGISKDEVSYAQDINFANKLTAEPFVSKRTICNGVREQIKNKEVDKYTVVMWYEGEDPDCTDDIIGGWVEIYMGFDYIED